MFTARRHKTFTAFLFVSALVFQCAGYSQTITTPGDSRLLRSGLGDPGIATSVCGSDISAQPIDSCRPDDPWVPQELSGLGPRGLLIARVRERTLQILQSDNECSAWFEETDPEAADVFRSLHYDIDEDGTANIYSVTDNFGDLLFKHPWGAKSIEDSGKDSFIELNGNGPFFVRKTRVMPSDPHSSAILPDQPQGTLIGPYQGATPQAQITIMLHELGHIVGRLPRDDNSWNGRSSENTRDVLRHCKREIRQMARQDLH